MTKRINLILEDIIRELKRLKLKTSEIVFNNLCEDYEKEALLDELYAGLIESYKQELARKKLNKGDKK